MSQLFLFQMSRLANTVQINILETIPKRAERRILPHPQLRTKNHRKAIIVPITMVKTQNKINCFESKGTGSCLYTQPLTQFLN